MTVAAGTTAGGAASGGQAGASAGTAGGAAAAAMGNAGAAGAQGTAGAGSGTAPPAGASTGTGTPTTDWTTGFDDTTRGYVQNKGWKGPADVLEGYRNLEKLAGTPADQILRLPAADAEATAWDPIYARLGRPATPEGYKLEVPKENGSPEFVSWASSEFHKLGLSEKQGRELTGAWNQYQQAQVQVQTDALKSKVEGEQASLKKEWGLAHEQNTAIAKRAAREFAVPQAAVDALQASIGFAATIKFFHSLGSKLGDASFVGGNPANDGTGPMTPEQAKARIATLKGDGAWTKRYLEGGASEKAEMFRLHKYAHPDS